MSIDPTKLVFKVSTNFTPQEAQAIVDAMKTVISTGPNILGFLSSLPDSTFYITRTSDDNADYSGRGDESTSLFWDLNADGTINASHATLGSAGVEGMEIGEPYVLRAMQGLAIQPSKASPTGELQSNLSRTIFHELAHAVTVPDGNYQYNFGLDGSTYAGVEALAIAAEDLIYAKDRHLPSRVGHAPYDGGSFRPSFDPATPFANVANVHYQLVNDPLHGLTGVFSGQDVDGGTISKGYGPTGPVLNFVTVSGQKSGLVTDVGGLSTTFKDAESGMLANVSAVRSGIENVATDLSAIRSAGAGLPGAAAGSALYDLLSDAGSIRLSQITNVVGNSNERFTDGNNNPFGRDVNYVGPVDRNTGLPHLGLQAETPSIIIGAAGFTDSAKKIDLTSADETLVGGDGGSNVLLAGSGSGNHLLTGGSGNDVLVGGRDNDTLDATRGTDLVLQSAGNDYVKGDGRTIFAAAQSTLNPVFDTSSAHGSTVEVGAGFDFTTLENVSIFLGNQYRTKFVGNGRTAETFIAGAGGGDFTLTNGDVAIGNPNATNIYRISTALVDGQAPTVSILDLGPNDTIYVDGKRFDGDVHKYGVTTDGATGYAVNETGTSTWGTEYQQNALKKNFDVTHNVLNFRPEDDLAVALQYLKLWGLDTPKNEGIVRQVHDDPAGTYVFYSEQQWIAANGFVPAQPTVLYFDGGPDGLLPDASMFTGQLPGVPGVNQTQSDLLQSGDERRDVAFVKASDSGSDGTIIFTDTLGSTQVAGLNLNVTGFVNGQSAGGIYFSTNDLQPGSPAPVPTGQITPDDGNWQNVYPSQTFGSGYLDISTPASMLGQPYDPSAPTTVYDSFAGFGGIGDVSVPAGPPRPTLTGDAGANILAYAATYSTIVGGGGGDTIEYALGDGSVVLDETDTIAAPNDLLALGSGIPPSSVIVSGTPEGDLQLRLGNGDTILIKGALASDATTRRGVQAVTFADGTLWSYADLVSRAATASTLHSDLYGDGNGQTFDPAGIARLVAGGGGGDTILFNKGYGAVAINEVDRSGTGQNNLQLGTGLTADATTVSGDVNGNLYLDFGNGDRLMIAGALANAAINTARYGIQKVAFADGTIWTSADLLTRLGTASETNTTLYGDSNAQSFDPGGIANGVVGGGGGDTIFYDAGYGPLALNELDASATPVNALIIGPNLNSATLSVSGNAQGDLILDFGQGNAVTIVGGLLSKTGATRGVQSVKFEGDGDLTWSYDQLLAHALTASADNTRLFGDGKANNFDSLGVARTITGGGGGDTFAYNRGYGAVTIFESDGAGAPNNVLALGASISPADVKVDGDARGDIILDMGGGDTVTLSGALRSTASSTQGVQRVTFANGTSWTYADLLAQLETPSSPHAALYGDATANTLDGHGIASSITAGGGGDNFIFNQGYGALSINEVDSGASPNNILTLGTGLTASAMKVASNSAGDLILSFANTDQITLVGALTRPAASVAGVQRIAFADGSSITYADLLAKVGTATGTNATIYGDADANLLDTAKLAHAVVGGGGGDTFVFNQGYGAVTITEQDLSSMPNNILSIGSGITPANVTVSGNDNGDLTLWNGLPDVSHDSVTLSKALLSSGGTTYGVQQVQFANGTTWSYDDLLARQTPGGPIGKTYYGDRSANLLDPASGSGVLYGNGGSDTFVYNAGYGSETIRETDIGGGDNVLKFGVGITPGSIKVTANAQGNIMLNVGSSPLHQITIAAALTNTPGSGTTIGIQHVTFSDGTSWSYADLLAQMVAGADGILYGDASAQQFHAGSGTKKIIGAGGGDTFAYAAGNGALEIDETDHGDMPLNRLVLGAGLSAGTVGVTQDAAGNVTLSFGGQDQIKLDGALTAPIANDGMKGVQEISFADGTIWSAAQLAAFATGTVHQHLGDTPLNIDEAALPAGNRPVIALDPTIGQSDIVVALKPGGNSMTLSYAGNLIASFDNIPSNAARTAQKFTFGDGTQLSLADLIDRAGNLADIGSLDGSSAAETFDTKGIVLQATGGGGGDTFLYNRGYGLVDINEQSAVGSPPNVLQLGSGILPTDVTVSGDGTRSLNLFLGGDDQIILDQGLNNDATTSYGVQEVHFANGTIWTHADLVNHAASPTDGNSTLYGDRGPQTFDPQGIATSIVGLGGGDTIAYNPGYGHIQIDESDETGVPSGTNTLAFGSGILPSSLKVTSDFFRGFTISLSSHDSVYIDYGRGTHQELADGVQRITFSDGTVWTYADLLAASEVPTTTNTTLFGDANPQTLDGQGIASALMGEGGGDTFVFKQGYGRVRISEYDASASTNTLMLGTGLNVSNLQVSHSSTDVMLTFAGSGPLSDTVTLTEQLGTYQDGTRPGVQKIIFGDGTVWTSSDLLNALGLGGNHASAPLSAEAAPPVADGGAYRLGAPAQSAAAPADLSDAVRRSAGMLIEASATFGSRSAFGPEDDTHSRPDDRPFSLFASHKSVAFSLEA